jgi:hypothetical protein
MNRLLLMKSALPLVFLAVAGVAESSEFRLVPSVAVSEEANDNIREVPTGGRLEFVTRVQPGAALHYQAPNTALDASYNLDYRYYARNTRGEEFNHAAALKGLLGLWENFFTLEAGDSYSRVSLDPARDTTGESVLVNQTNQNIAMVSPYLNWRPGDRSTLKTGYRFSDITYGGGSSGTSGSSAIDKRINTVFADFASKRTERLELNADYAFSSTFSSRVSYRQHDLSTGFRYEYSDKSFFYGGIGYSFLDFSNGLSSNNPFWNVGVSHNFGATVATLESRVQYTEDPLTLSTRQTDYTAKLDKTLERGRLGISAGYSTYRVTQDAGQDRDRYQVTLGGSHELLTRLRGSANLIGERLSRSDSTFTSNLPYHLVIGGALVYDLGEGLTLEGSYMHISYRENLSSSAGSIEVNRGVLEVRKLF